MWLGHFVEHLVCNQRKNSSTHPTQTQILEFFEQSAGWGAYIARAKVPVVATNRDQCLAVHHVLVARALVPVGGNNRDRCPT